MPPNTKRNTPGHKATKSLQRLSGESVGNTGCGERYCRQKCLSSGSVKYGLRWKLLWTKMFPRKKESGIRLLNCRSAFQAEVSAIRVAVKVIVDKNVPKEKRIWNKATKSLQRLSRERVFNTGYGKSYCGQKCLSTGSVKYGLRWKLLWTKMFPRKKESGQGWIK